VSLLTDRSRQSFADEPSATDWKAKASVKKTEVTEEVTPVADYEEKCLVGNDALEVR
jgi:hypothetical protein